MNHSSGEINQSSEEYPILWFQPEIGFTLKESLQEKKTLHFFSELQEVVEFSGSLGSSFLLIVPNDFDEQQLGDLNKDLYRRRLSDIEEESILQWFEISKSLRVYAFCSEEDFESEVFVENDQMKWDVKEVMEEFRKEFIFCERKQRGLEKADAVFVRAEESEEYDKEEYRQCKEFCIERLKEIANKKGHEKMKLIYYVNLGTCCSELEERQKALEYFSKALDIAKQNYEETHFSLAFLLITLANVHVDLGEDEKALEYDLKALDIRRTVYGEMHEKTANLYFGIAELYKGLTEYPKALEYHQKCLEIRKSIFGEIHTDTLNSYYMVAVVYDTLEQDQNAVECYLKVLDIHKSLDRKPDGTLASVTFNLGELYGSLEEYQKALEYHQKCLEINISIYGEIHVETAISYKHLGVVYFNLQDYQKSLESRMKALDIYISLYGEFHQDVLDLHRQAAFAYGNLEQREKSIEHHLKVLEISIYSTA